ncbi:MAG TPA: hypothetical protein VEQ10_12300 [Vicinamibacteria bacterium]|nr:hypothetical protein [Vicinamibacteria bacterium]
MSRGERGGSKDERGGPRKACCMISELLEESGIDRERIRAVRRQVLEGVILLCQWQLQRMGETQRPAGEPPPRRRARKVSVE